MKHRRKITLGLAVLAIMLSGALWTAGQAWAAGATIIGQLNPMPPNNPDVMIYLRPVGQSTGTDDVFYTPDPYNSDQKGLGYYEFDSLIDSNYIITPVSPGFQFNPPAHSVQIVNGQITLIDNNPPGTTPVVNFATVLTTNGQCGTSSGQTLSATPAALCNAGTPPSAVSGSGPWTWTCTGINNGTNASCSANHTVCGAASGQTTASTPTLLCATGETASAVSGGSAAAPWSWTCKGSDSVGVSCSAPYGTIAVNGLCGTSNGQTLTSAPTNNLCSTGTPPSAVSGTGPWTWTCTGTNNGTNASCSANIQSSAGGYTSLIWNAGTQSKSVSITPGQTQYYTFTVPAGFTTLSMNISLITQVANLDMVLTQSSSAVSTASLNTYLSNALAAFNTGACPWSTPYYKSYPPTVWAEMGTDFSGEAIYLKASTKDGYGVAASIPGTYYVAVKNESTTASATYYVYVKQ